MIFGDDIGQINISAYSMGEMVALQDAEHRPYRARKALMFYRLLRRDSCTAGLFLLHRPRAATPLRTGLSKVGAPGCAGGPAEGRCQRLLQH
ncbi:hypothetical protein ACU4GD_07740 [Cupriavidus basilensis]